MASPHALCFPFPVLGHINPMMQLALSLARSPSAFRITFLLTQHRLDQMQKESSSPSPHPSISLVAVPDGIADHDRDGPLAALKIFQAVGQMAASGVVEKLVEKLQKQEPPVTCIISDTFVSWSQGLADKFGIPRVAFWTSCASSYVIHHYVDLNVAQSHLPVKDKSTSNAPPDMISYIPGIPPFPVDFLPTVLQVEDISNMRFKSFNRMFEGDRECAWLIVNSFDDLEPEPFKVLKQSFKVLGVGPLLPPGVLSVEASSPDSTEGPVQLWKEDESCLDWLDTRPVSSVIYVSFGSIGSLLKDDIHELALGLESSGHSFLWVIRSKPGSKASDVFPEGFLERTKDQGLIISWAPQLKVLSHPSVGGFLTHCGWNSTIESISLGVPLLGMPTDFGEQKTISWLIELEWGVGLRLKLDKDACVTKVGVDSGVRALMEEGKQYRRKVGEMNDAAKRTIVEGGSSYCNLQVFADFLRHKVLTK